MATRGLGTLTLDLLLKVGGFKQGMTEAERAAERAMRAITESARRASKDVNQSFSGGVKVEGLQKAARIVQTELKKTEDSVKAVKATFGDVGFRIPGLRQAEIEARKLNEAMALLRERTAQLLQAGFGERVAAQVATPLELYRKQVELLNFAAAQGVINQQTFSRALHSTTQAFIAGTPAMQRWNLLVEEGKRLMAANVGPQDAFRNRFKELTQLALSGQITPEVRTSEIAKEKAIRDSLTGVTAENNRLDTEAKRIKESQIPPQREYNEAMALTQKLLDTQRIDQAEFNTEAQRLKAILDASNPAQQEQNRLMAEAAKLAARLQDPLIQYQQRLKEIAAMKIAAPDLVSDEIETAAIKEAEDAYNKLNPEIQENLRLEKEAAAIKAANTTAQERYDAAIAHSASLIGKVGFTQADHNREIARQKAILDASNPALQEHARLMAEGARATKTHMSAQEQLDAAIAHADKLLATYDATLKRTAIDQQTHTRMVAAARAEFDRASQSTQKLSGRFLEFSKLLNRGFGLQSFVAQALSIFAIINLVRSIIQITDELKLLENRLRLVTHSTSDLVRTQKELFEVAQRTRQEYTGVTDLYIRLAQASSELGATQQELIAVTEATGNALAIAGTGAERARGVLIQLTQGLGGGTFRAEEFNSVLEGAAPLVRIVAKHIDRFAGSVQALRKEVREGTVTSKEFFDAIRDGSEELSKQVASTPVTISQAFTQLKNVFQQAVLGTDMQPLVKGILDLKVLLEDPQFQQALVDFVNLLLTAGGAVLRTGEHFAQLALELKQSIAYAKGELSEIEVLEAKIQRVGFTLRQAQRGGFLESGDITAIGLSVEGLTAKLERLRKELELLKGQELSEIVITAKSIEAPVAPIGDPKALEQIRKQIEALEQQRVLLGKNAAATMAYRIAVGDLRETFQKAAPDAEDLKGALIAAAAALEQETAVQSVKNSIEALQRQAAVLNLTEKEAFEYNLTQGEQADQLERTGKAQAGLTEEYRKAWEQLQQQKDVKTIIEGLVEVEQLLLEASGRTAEAQALATQERYKKLLDAVSAETERAVADMEALSAQVEGAVIDPTVDASGIEHITIEAKKAKYSLEELQQIEIKIKAAMDIESFRAQADALDRRIEDIRTDFGRQEQTIQARVDTGLLSEIGARRELIRVHQREAAALQDLYNQYKALADISGMDEVRRKMEELGIIIEDLKTSVDTLGKAMADAFEEGIGEALGDVAKGVASLGEAAESFLESLTDALIDWASEQVAAQMRDVIFGPNGPLGEILKTIGGGGLFAGGGAGLFGDGLEEIAVTAQRLPEGVGEVAAAGAETAGMAAAITAAGTAAGASITGATAALTTAGATVAGAITTAGTGVAGAISAAGSAAAAAIGAASASSAIPIPIPGAAGGGLLADIAVVAGLGMGRYAGGGPLDVFSGGFLRGPGTPTSDSLLLRGSRDEFMVQARAVGQPGGRQFLDAYNSGLVTVREIRHGLESIGRVPRFAGGGSLSSGASPAAVSSPAVSRRQGDTINQYLTINAPGGNVSRQTELQITAAAARGARTADRRNN
jgi:tape measure domain-containing protein